MSEKKARSKSRKLAMWLVKKIAFVIRKNKRIKEGFSRHADLLLDTIITINYQLASEQ